METYIVIGASSELLLAVFRPEGSGQKPAILVAPGGLDRGDFEAYAWAGERFAGAGYMTVIASYRAASPHEDVNDLRVALEWLLNDSAVDAGRAGIFGHSRGGLAALRFAANDSRLGAVVSVAAPVDLAAYVQNISAFAPGAAGVLMQFIGGAPDDIPEVYGTLEPRALAPTIRQPVRLIHGTADMRVPFEYSRQLESVLRTAGNDAIDLKLLPGVGHFLELGMKGYQFDTVCELAIDWFDQYLRPSLDFASNPW